MENKFLDTINCIDSNTSNIIDEMVLLQHIQTAVLRNDHYLIKDKDTQAIFESILSKNRKKIAPNNHQKGYDLMHLDNQVSIKSGVVNNDLLKFSYSRTTAHKTLEDKINYLSTFENLILGIASEKIKCDPNSEVISHFKYYIYHFNANKIDFKNMHWEEDDNVYHGQDKQKNIQVSIVKKMSDQPWIHMPTENIKCDLAMTVKVINRNKRKILIIQRADSDTRLYYDIYDHRKKLKSIKGMEPKCIKSTTPIAMG